ncbi:hypothetical protein [Shimia sp.]|uniref:hypothetical protein n=1 Tax=Shimia sp. TaxID=1954381 RepID=UPI00356894C6
MTRLPAHFSYLLIAVLVLTGHSMAVARGLPVAAGMMELCTGTGPVMTPVDAEGMPTGPAHISPEISLSLFDAVAPEVPFAAPQASRGRRLADSQPTPILIARPVAVLARGPPTPA